MLTKKIPYLLVLTSCLFAGGLGCAEKKNANASVIAPDFSLVDLKGEKFSLSGLKGNVVFLDFWATWCPPCVMSAPVVEGIVKTYTGKPLQVISLSLDQDEAPVKEFIEKHHLVNRVAVVKDSGVDAKYDVSGIPAFYLIDKKGNVVGRWVGFSPDLELIWKREIDRLLAQ